jgi:branched-subunit amino acid transport protein
MTWAPLLVACAACYVIKLAGLSMPQRLLQDSRVQRTVPLLPVALLAGLIAINTFSSGMHLALDARAVALTVAGAAVLLRAPFLVVVVAAAAIAALVRFL